MTTFAIRLRTERKRLKLTQGALAKLVDLKKGQSFIGNLETEARSDTPYIAELAHALGVDAYWLKTGKGNRTGQQSLSPDEALILRAFPLLDADGQELWLELAKKKIAREEASKQNAA